MIKAIMAFQEKWNKDEAKALKKKAKAGKGKKARAKKSDAGQIILKKPVTKAAKGATRGRKPKAAVVAAKAKAKSTRQAASA